MEVCFTLSGKQANKSAENSTVHISPLPSKNIFKGRCKKEKIFLYTSPKPTLSSLSLPHLYPLHVVYLTLFLSLRLQSCDTGISFSLSMLIIFLYGHRLLLPLPYISGLPKQLPIYAYPKCLRDELNKHKIFSQLLLGILPLITLAFPEMQPTMSYMRLAIISISFTTFSILCDARIFAQFLKSQGTELEKQLKAINHLELDLPLPSSNVKPLEVSPPLSFPPFDSLAPLPLPGNVPLSPYCANPPFSQNPPQPNTPSSSSSPSSSAPTCSPIPKPPPANGPTPHPPGPPTTIPSPPKNPPSPPQPVPGPPALAPPAAYPPPSGPTSPPQKKPPQSGAMWCVAKPAVPGPIVQEALDYACGSGADCKSIQPNGSCYKPDTLLSHASYAFNSYWQSTRAAGGTCDFGGTAMVVTVDPSFDGCHFFYNG